MARKSPLQRFKNRVLSYAITAGVAVAGRIDLDRSRRLGIRIGRLAYRLARREAARARRNIATAFPGMNHRAVDDLARTTFEHLGISVFEVAAAVHQPVDGICDRIVIEGGEHLQNGIASGRGVVFYTGHCGNWEWFPMVFAKMGVTVHAIVRELFDARLNQLALKLRQRSGARTVGRGSQASAREILTTLRSGGVLAFLVDQSIRAESVNVPFFGVPAPTPLGPAKLAIRGEAAVIGGFMERRGSTHHATFLPALLMTRDDDPVELTARMTAEVERQIRRAPAQWVWIHERWKARQEVSGKGSSQ